MEGLSRTTGGGGVLLPIVCRACGGVQRLTVDVLRTREHTACGACGRVMDLTLVAASLPRVLPQATDAPVLARPVSEFP